MTLISKSLSGRISAGISKAMLSGGFVVLSALGPSLCKATATVERLSRQHRPNAPRSRKSTPETISAVRCALSQLQGEPAPTLQAPAPDRLTQEPG
ncbi:unnamed protein product, partial [Iphiclides podalirius]